MDAFTFAVVGIIVGFATVLSYVLIAVGVVLLMGTPWIQKRVRYYLRDRPYDEDRDRNGAE